MQTDFESGSLHQWSPGLKILVRGSGANTEIKASKVAKIISVSAVKKYLRMHLLHCAILAVDHNPAF